LGHSEQQQLADIINRLHNLTIDVVGFDGLSRQTHQDRAMIDNIDEVGEMLSEARRRLDISLRHMRKASS
jgi:hypothetical protein